MNGGGNDRTSVSNGTDLPAFDGHRLRKPLPSDAPTIRTSAVFSDGTTSGLDVMSLSHYGENANNNQPNAKGPLGLLDANVYATKKTIAQGMLDVALLTANASQLKYLLQIGSEHEFYYLMMTLISLSIVLQMGIGIAVLMNTRYNINVVQEQPMAEYLNNFTTFGVFVVVVLNIFISPFGMSEIDPEDIRRMLTLNKTFDLKI